LKEDDGNIAQSFFADGADHNDALDVVCPGCGISLLDLYRDGRMGCAKCYTAFGSTVHRALIVLHGAHAHIGKSIVPDARY
jgi:protein-arginine kinase activator protein McsA